MSKNTDKKYILTLLVVCAIVALLLYVAIKTDNNTDNQLVDLPIASINPTNDLQLVTTNPTSNPDITSIPNPAQIIEVLGPQFDYSTLPNPSKYTDYEHPWVIINKNQPYFTEEEKHNLTSFEYYSPLDNLGRCGSTFANICIEIMPTDARESIGSVKPTGWHSDKYDIVDGKYLYNRCHLIGFQLAGENANKYNLITGTRYLNIKGMLPFENMIADTVKGENIHVLYRVTPVFRNNNLVADGVIMEGYSVEDEGEAICFCVFALNIQPGIVIDYATGESHLK